MTPCRLLPCDVGITLCAPDCMTWRVTKGSAGHVVIQKCSPCQGLIWAQVLLEKKVNIHREQAVFPDTLRVCTVTHLAAFQRLRTASWSRHFKDHSSQGHVAPVTEQQIQKAASAALLFRTPIKTGGFSGHSTYDPNEAYIASKIQSVPPRIVFLS